VRVSRRLGINASSRVLVLLASLGRRATSKCMTRCDHLSEETDPHKTAKACKPPQQAEAQCLSDAQAKMQAWLARRGEKVISSKTLPIIDSSSSCISNFKLQCLFGAPHARPIQQP